MIAPSRFLLGLLLAAGLAVSACSSDHTGPAEPADPAIPDMAGEGIPLTIDVATGAVSVGSLPSGDDGLSHSLLGSDVIDLHAGNCSFSPVPRNNKLTRCSFELSLTNKLSVGDLVTPATFPRPPQGVTGLLVFPYAAGAIGVNGGSAVPSPDWDEQPANFFNDVAACGRAESDCYRWERFTAPLLAGTRSETHVVGFDIPKSALSVGVYIVVAADIREPRQIILAGRNELDGEVPSHSSRLDLIGGVMRVGTRQYLFANTYEEVRSFAGFDLSPIPADAEILSAELRVSQIGFTTGFYTDGNEVKIEHVDLGAALGEEHFDAARLNAELVSFSWDGFIGQKTVDVTAMVAADLAAGRQTSGYRLRLPAMVHEPIEALFATAAYGNGGARPTLMVRYR